MKLHGRKTHTSSPSHRGRKEPYLLQSLALASLAKRMPVMDMEQVPRVSGREAVELLLRCWVAAVGLSWTGCRLAWLWPRWSLLLPQASRYLLAGYARGHGGCCPSGCRLCSTPGSSRCGHRSLKNWLWWLRAEDVTAGQRNKIKILDAVVNLTITVHKTEWTLFFFFFDDQSTKLWLRNGFRHFSVHTGALLS